jgi:hypothetical protein
MLIVIVIVSVSVSVTKKRTTTSAQLAYVWVVRSSTYWQKYESKQYQSTTVTHSYKEREGEILYKIYTNKHTYTYTYIHTHTHTTNTEVLGLCIHALESLLLNLSSCPAPNLSVELVPRRICRQNIFAPTRVEFVSGKTKIHQRRRFLKSHKNIYYALTQQHSK